MLVNSFRRATFFVLGAMRTHVVAFALRPLPLCGIVKGKDNTYARDRNARRMQRRFARPRA